MERGTDQVCGNISSLGGGSLVLEQVSREAGELPAMEKFRSYLVNALNNLMSNFHVNLL